MPFFISLVVILFLSVSLGQDCKTPGKSCSDDKQCCGGCCRSGICIITYKDCELIEYQCENAYCPAGFECYMFKPVTCQGCETQQACRPFNDRGSIRHWIPTDINDLMSSKTSVDMSPVKFNER